MDTARLSFAQQRLWLLDRLLPIGSVYNLARAAHLNGTLDVDALRCALNDVARRHESLRSSFAVGEDGDPVQVIAPELHLALHVEDLGAWPQEDRQQEAQRIARDEAQAPFDLNHGPLLRARLLRLTEQEHWLLLTYHHIAADDWSQSILWRELSTLYDAHRQRLTPPPLAPPVQYGDYTAWQRNFLQGDVIERQLAYWKQALAELPVLTLPTDRVRPAHPSYRGQQFVFTLGEELTRSLRALGHHEGTTFFTAFLAAVQVLLCRYTGQEDVAVGVPVAGRRRPEMESVVGFFVNTLVLRGDLSGQPTFRDYLGRVRLRTEQAYAHQDIPFEMLVAELQPDRDPTRNPLFQVMVNRWTADGQVLRLADLEPANVVATDTGASPFDLDLILVESRGQCTVTMTYATDLFDAATIERLAGHFTTLLEAIVADPDRPIGELPLLTTAERQQVLVTWNDTAVDYPRDRCVHQLFEDQAARTPEAVAVVYEDHPLTYAELNARANQVAHQLIAMGVGPEVLVGLCVERSLELVVGLLGILKAGGAYVPLDPRYPSARLAFMLADAEAPVLVTQETLLAQLPPFAGHVLCLDRDGPAISQQPAANPAAAVTTDSLAYVIYTSGSTGTPKGVAIEHGSAGAFLHWAATVFSAEDLAGTLFATSVCFDLSVFELFAPLSCGGTVLVAENVLQLPTLPSADRVTLVNTVPSAMRALLAGGLGAARARRTVNLAGEPLDAALVQALYAGTPVQQVYNLYGPTEATTYSTVAAIARGDTAPPTIGRPIANTRVYVLDGQQQPVPVGVIGELYVAGAGLARGYLHRPELTAEKFLPDPFAPTPGARMYRTGDRARYRPDGQLEFLGRLDDQVKIRGFRIELGEVEAVLAEHPTVHRAVVLAREDTPSDPRLVAYVVPAEGTGLDRELLRTHLRARLPEYMCPAAYVALERLPLTPNGKVDRRALPAPTMGRERTEDTFVPARTALEGLIAEVWTEVLTIERVGMQDDFFALGGHSLRAAQVLGRLSRLLGVDLSLRAFFEAPTVAALARQVEETFGAEAAGADAPALGPVPRTGELPLSFAQQRLWFLGRLLPDTAVYNIPAAWSLQGPLDAPALAASLTAIVARHEALRTRVALGAAGDPRQLIDPPYAVTLPLTDLSAWPPGEREARARVITDHEAERPFDLAAGPVLRAHLLRLAADEHWLLVTMHHIASDGWSLGVFGRELAAAYAACRHGREPQFPALPIQYGDHAVWQRAWLQGEVLARQVAYWTHQLAGLGPLTLPTDRPRPPVASHRGARLGVDLPAPIIAALKTLGRREGATLFMTLLAAFQVLLSRYTGQEDIAVGTPIAGRGQPEVEGLIGAFLNTLVLRTDLAGDPGFREVLRRVRDTALGAFTHQDVPFEQLVEALAPSRDLGRAPLFQVLFVLQNAPDAPLALEGLAVRHVPLASQTAKFDLTLSVRETPSGLHAIWEYATDVFDAATIARMAGHFGQLLDAIVADPDQRIGELPLLTVAERHQVLVEWNDTAASYRYPTDRGVHELFEDQVARTPEAVAVVYEDQSITYGSLNARANQVAHQLIALGVGPEVLVGLCVERSLELIIGLLGILKAGGAYVTIDPAWPPDRARMVAEDARLTAVVRVRAHGDPVPSLSLPSVFVDLWSASTDARAENNPDIPVSPTNLVYVLYTSGTTGVPKGVMVEHRHLVQYVWAVTDRLGLDAPGHYALLQPLTFDIGQTMVFPALARGGTLHLISDARAVDAIRLTDYFRQHAVEYLKITPSHLAALLDQQPSAALLPRRALILGGEASHWDLIDRLWALAPSCAIWNHYGPTETTVGVSVYRLDPAAARPALTVPIGRPLPNVRYYVLDQHLQPVPVGVPGELCIGGAQVARGYLDRPELTAARFVPDPFSDTPQARFYRSGDQVRYLADGTVEFLGRHDQQVKIRGFRIELGEIEAALHAVPGVREAAVAVREAATGGQRLVAFVVTENPAALDDHQLRAALATRLPDYMVPSQFVPRPSLPRTPHGKLDRPALDTMDVGPVATEATSVAPRNSLEKVIAQIWCDVLRLDQVGAHDNFFALGGHSLLAMDVVWRIRRQLDLEPPLLAIFEHPTIEALAIFLLRKQAEATDVEEMERVLAELEGLATPRLSDEPQS